MFNIRKNIVTTLGQNKLDLLCSINLKASGEPEVNGSCQYAAIEAAKVLLDEKYIPQSVSITTANIGSDNDPIQLYLGEGSGYGELIPESKVDYEDCESTQKLVDRMKQLKNGELLLVNGTGQDDVYHAYVIFKQQGIDFLIDADRGVFKCINDQKDFIQKINEWEKDKPTKEFDYGEIRFVETTDAKQTEDSDAEQEEAQVSLCTYKLTSNDLKFLPDAKMSSPVAHQSPKVL